MLTGLITVEILRNIGTIKGLGNKLVDSYKKSYKWTNIFNTLNSIKTI